MGFGILVQFSKVWIAGESILQLGMVLDGDPSGSDPINDGSTAFAGGGKK
jgi:hypothetical protein